MISIQSTSNDYHATILQRSKIVHLAVLYGTNLVMMHCESQEYISERTCIVTVGT